MKKILLILLMLVMGCAPWVQVGGLYQTESQNYSVDLPKGWMRWNQGNDLLITRDGILLQNIQIARLNIEEPLKHTKKKFSKSMLAQEVAEVVLDNIASNKDVLDFKIIENSPIRISENSGFKAVYTYKTNDGLKIKSVYCGFISDKWFYGINYNAAQRYYFDRDLKVFDDVLKSFKLIKIA